MIVNFANRAHNHNFESDWVVRSLLDTDYYKIAMLQLIWLHYPHTRVTFSLINRAKTVKLGEIIDEKELRRQLDHVMTLRFKENSELVWLAGASFYGKKTLFRPEFIAWLKDFRLPPYELQKVDGQWELRFPGTWLESTMWEIYALSTINELRTRAALSKLTEFELDLLYAAMKVKLFAKFNRMRGVPGLSVADFGTRRRHSFLWQEYVVTAFKAELPDIFSGTSNAYLAFVHDIPAIGTNAHELPMVLAALAGEDDDAVRAAPYEVLRLWKETYGEAMNVFLPDTFGTTGFLDNAPDWVADFKGARLDSKDPFKGGDELIRFYESRGRDATQKLVVPSDGLDVDSILALHAHFGGRILGGHAPSDFVSAADFEDPTKWFQEPRIRDSYGWGTMLTNDAVGCHPRGLADFDPISIVCKAETADGIPVFKLSDNYLKSTGAPEAVARGRRIFGSAGMDNVPVTV